MGLLATVKGRKHAWFGHVTCMTASPEYIFQGTLENGRRRGRHRKCWMDNIIEWRCLPMPELLTKTSCRKDWKRISAESSLVSPRRPNRSRDLTQLKYAPLSPWQYSDLLLGSKSCKLSALPTILTYSSLFSVSFGLSASLGAAFTQGM